MSHLEAFYPESRFGGFSDVDGTVSFYGRVNALVDASSVVLDVGCGRGAYGEDPVAYRRELRILKGKVGRVVGIDVDEVGAENPFLDEFHVIEEEGWPVDDRSVDMVLSDWVLEHVANAEAFFSEARRVLKPGGYLCIRTANRWSYVGLLSSLIPSRYHARVLAGAGKGREDRDVFPTVYACNGVGKLRRALKRHGFDAVVYGYEAEPRYLEFSRVAYALGVLHQRLAPGFLKPAIFAFATPSAP